MRQWRESIKELIRESMPEIEFSDPSNRTNLSPKITIEIDKAEISKCDLMIVKCFPVATWGTAMEILFAWECHVPTIAWVANLGSVDPWIQYHTIAQESRPEAIIEAVASIYDLMKVLPPFITEGIHSPVV